MKNKNLKEKKTNLINKLNKLKITLFSTPIILSLMKVKVFAESSINTAEVKTATENIKNAVVKLAMPIRKYFNVC